MEIITLAKVYACLVLEHIKPLTIRHKNSNSCPKIQMTTCKKSTRFSPFLTDLILYIRPPRSPQYTNRIK